MCCRYAKNAVMCFSQIFYEFSNTGKFLNRLLYKQNFRSYCGCPSFQLNCKRGINWLTMYFTAIVVVAVCYVLDQACVRHPPQAGFDPPAQSDTSYEADALPPSHHGWIKITYYLCSLFGSFSRVFLDIWIERLFLGF